MWGGHQYGCRVLALSMLCCCRVDLHTQENDGSENSEEAEKLIEAAATLFSENRKPHYSVVHPRAAHVLACSFPEMQPSSSNSSMI